MLDVGYGDMSRYFRLLPDDLFSCVSLPRMRVHSCFVYRANFNRRAQYTVD